MAIRTDDTPDGIALSGHPTGIKRIGKLPLLIGLAVLVIIMIALGYALHQRAQPHTLAGEDEKTARQPDQMAARELTGRYTGGVTEAQETTIPITPVVADKTPAPKPPVIDNTPKVTRPIIQEVKSDPAPPPIKPPPRRTAEEEARDREKAKQVQMRYGAMQAPIAVSFDEVTDQNAGLVNSGQSQPQDGTLNRQAEFIGSALERLTGNAPGTDDPNKQKAKIDFLNRDVKPAEAVYGREPVNTPWELRTGTVIPAVLETGINSDLPGTIRAQVSQNVYDTATGRYLVIPQGTKVIGTYDSQIAYGQNRVLVAWSRLIYPNGEVVEIGHMGGADSAGYAGFADQVDNHYWRIFGSALLMSVIAGGYALATDNGTQENVVLNEVGRQMAQTSDRVLSKNLNIQPTIEIRPGYKFNVFVNKDIRILSPYLATRFPQGTDQ